MEELLHLMVDRKQRERGDWELGITFRGMSLVTCFLQ
jgi:hypothetical protein